MELLSYFILIDALVLDLSCQLFQMHQNIYRLTVHGEGSMHEQAVIPVCHQAIPWSAIVRIFQMTDARTCVKL